MFSLFHFGNEDSISMDNYVEAFVATCVGISRLTRTPIPRNSLLREIATGIFTLYDVNNSKYLDLKEITSWMESCKEFFLFLEKFEPKTQIIMPNSLFTNFPFIDASRMSDEVLNALKMTKAQKIGIERKVFKRTNRMDIFRHGLYSPNIKRIRVIKFISNKIEKFNYKTGTRNNPAHSTLKSSQRFMSPSNQKLNSTLNLTSGLSYRSLMSPLFPRPSNRLTQNAMESISYKYFNGNGRFILNQQMIFTKANKEFIKTYRSPPRSNSLVLEINKIVARSTKGSN